MPQDKKKKGFDPDAYLAKFDPDKYLGEEPVADILDVFKSSFAETPEQLRGLKTKGMIDPRLQAGVAGGFAAAGLPPSLPRPAVETLYGIARNANLIAPTLLSGLGATLGAVGGPAGIAAGGGLGMATGENLNRAMGRIMLGETKKSFKQDIGEVAETGLMGAMGEAGGQIALKGLSKVVAPFTRQVNPEMAEFVRKNKIRALPSEILDESTFGSEAVRAGERVAESTLTGGAAIKKLKAPRFNQLMNVARRDADALLGSTKDPSEVKTIIEDAISGNSQKFTQEASKLYKQIDRQTQGTGVDIRSVKAFAQRALSKIPQKVRVAAGKGGTEASALFNQLDNIASLPDKIPFEDAHFYRSQLLTTVRQDVTPIGGRIKGTAGKMANFLENRMEKAASAFEKNPRSISGRIEFQGRKLDPSGNIQYEEFKIIDPNSPANNANISVKPGEDLTARVLAKEKEFGKRGIVEQIRNANQFYREGKELYNNEFIRSIAKNDPEKLANATFTSIENVKQLKKAVGDGVFKNVQRAKIEELIRSGIKTEKTGESFFSGSEVLRRWNLMSNEIKREGFAPEVQRTMDRFFRIAASLPTKEQGLGLWGIGQGLGALGAGASGDLTTTGAIVLGPYLFAKLVTSKVGSRWLTEGMKIKPFTNEAVRFGARFSAYLAGQKNPFQSAKQDVTR